MYHNFNILPPDFFLFLNPGRKKQNQKLQHKNTWVIYKHVRCSEQNSDFPQRYSTS